MSSGGEFETMQERLRTILPDSYQESFESIEPVSMGSAGLKYDADGRVAWDEIWGSFCDLAMAGGPPHRGTLLEPGRAEAIAEQPERYAEAVSEICRGLNMVTGLHAERAPMDGWVRMYCTGAAMVGWMMRAIVMENVSASAKGLALYLPAGPEFRLEKEIKNVVTATAKTFHYWTEHMTDERRQAVADAFRAMQREQVLLQPAMDEEPAGEALRAAAGIREATGLKAFAAGARGWVGVECGEVGAAVWMMRALVASQVLSHREGTVVFVPGVEGVVEMFARVWGFAVANGVATRVC